MNMTLPAKIKVRRSRRSQNSMQGYEFNIAATAIAAGATVAALMIYKTMKKGKR